MSKEAMKLALSTLEGWANYDDWVWPESALEQAKRNTVEAITALRQALKEKQEPVAWMYVNDDGECEQIEYGPVLDDPGVTPLYTAPPKKQWVGLTDQEINSVRHKRDWTAAWSDTTFARAIEVKLREKNHG